MASIYKEIDRANPEIKQLRAKIESLGARDAEKQALIMETGHRIETALEILKEEKSEEIIAAFRKTVMASRRNKISAPETFINAAFLIDKGREVEFDDIMEIIGERDGEQCDYHYAGPMPIFNFVDLRILPEKWEL